MRLSSTLCAALLLSGLFISTAANAQSPVEEIAPLPTTFSTEQLESLLQLSARANPEVEAAQPHARRRLPRRQLHRSPEEDGYMLAVQKLGVDNHRFVHCDLANGKVRTGVITDIHEYGFVLKDGILFDRWIPYSDLKAAPRPVAAVGTRIGQGIKWTGLVLVTIPLLPFAFLFWDGC